MSAFGSRNFCPRTRTLFCRGWVVERESSSFQHPASPRTWQSDRTDTTVDPARIATWSQNKSSGLCQRCKLGARATFAHLAWSCPDLAAIRSRHRPLDIIQLESWTHPPGTEGAHYDALSYHNGSEFTIKRMTEDTDGDWCSRYIGTAGLGMGQRGWTLRSGMCNGAK
ncbi:hypothetical protein HPB47_013822 [Ixodes persulcatus]|uniref:Uncharacterized protein n=1 Tax=Ixodes persulcatus TaxID=34615 RepID=A0AC60QXJ2_IXOPE|nr:hypothetical protein HPB47_013822 [Ixodes persulcatus]